MDSPDWNDPTFHEEIAEWIARHARMTGAIEQPHVRWWSTVFRVPTSEGTLW